jgi:vitamin-K-epoxide reductase (warfarin-sensitive)
MRYVIAVLSLAGVVVSCFALAAHYAPPAQAIDLGGSRWNSAYVNQSPYAEVDGIPVAAVGIAGYALLAMLALLGRRVLTVYLSGLEFVYAFYLTNIEAHILQVWCVYCVLSQILILLIAMIALLTLVFGPTPDIAR